MDIRYDGKVVIVTGATSGIGQSTAEEFAKNGATVVVVGRRADKGNAVVEGIKREGGDAIFIACDVTNDEQVDLMVETVISTYGKIDVLVNNAGVMKSFQVESMDIKRDYEDVFAVNIRSYFYMSSKVLPHMLKQESGNIINTASIGALNGGPGMSSYCSSKGAVIQFTRSLAKEVANRGIRVNAVLPGLIHTEMMPEGGPMDQIIGMIPMGRAGKGHEIAEPILYLCSEYASFITAASIVVDGGQSA